VLAVRSRSLLPPKALEKRSRRLLPLLPLWQDQILLHPNLRLYPMSTKQLCTRQWLERSCQLQLSRAQ